MKIEINASKRDMQGTGASRRLRRAGRVPGVVYGSEKAAQAVDLNHKDLYFALKNEAFHSSVLTLNLDGAKESVLLRDFQMHPYKQLVMHIDFQRVAAGQVIHISVPLHFMNSEDAPGVKLQHGIVSHVLSEVEVICLPRNLPEHIEVDVGALNLGDSLRLSDIKLPEGVELAALQRDEDTVFVTVLAPQAIVEVEAEDGEGEAAAAD